MNQKFREDEIRFLVDKWHLWKGIVIGIIITLIILSLDAILIK